MKKKGILPPIKIAIIGAGGDIGKGTLNALLRLLPESQDQDVEIVHYNRLDPLNNKAELSSKDAHDDADFDYDQESGKRKFYIKVSPTSDIAQIKGAVLVIFSAGTSASQSKLPNREASLPLVSGLILEYAEYIKKYASEAFIWLGTNPTDVTAMLMQKLTGFSADKILGFGTFLDSRRFITALQRNLEKEGFDIKKSDISAIVIGGHSEDTMVLLKDRILINSKSLSDFIAVHPNKAEMINRAVEDAAIEMRTTGFDIVRGGGKTYNGPSISFAIATRALLFGREAYHLSGARVLTRGEKFAGLTNCCISVPIVIKRGSVSVNHLDISEETKSLLVNVANFHQKLFKRAIDMPNEEHFQFSETLALLKKHAEVNAALNERMKENIKELDQDRALLLKSLFDVVNNPDGLFSVIRIQLKESTDKNEGKHLLSLAKIFFVKNGIKICSSENEANQAEYFDLQGGKDTKEFLRKICWDKSQQQNSRL
ncbi:MAG: malate/lactate dehydrogenase [Rickettsiales bacterium]|jgi:malate/lactate dehydrogenase